MKRLKRQDTYLTLIFTMIFVFAFSSIGYAVNSPPVSDPNGPYTGTAGISVAFDGTGSSDPDGDPLTYAWNFGDGNTGIGPTPTHVYAAMGLYTVTLIVNDGVGATDTDTTTATISNAPPVCNADGPYNGTVGSPVQLDGSGSFDPDGIIILYEWDFDGDGTYDWSSATSGNTTHTYTLAGFFTAILRVTDDDGDEDSCTTDVNVYLEVSVDIKPMSCPNPLNVKSKGVLPVAILGTSEFDVSQIDPASLLLEGVPPIRYELDDVGTPFNGVSLDDCLDCTAEGPDGFLDLVLHFSSQDVVATIGPVEDGDCIFPTLMGDLLDGTPIEGTDSVRIIKKK